MRHPRMHQATLAAGSLGAMLAFACLPAEAAVVRGVRVLRDATTTRIAVDVDGEIRFRTRTSDDGKAMFVDLDDATLDAGVPRLLPVSDRRVDGVLLVWDEDSRIVRVSVDLAGRQKPLLESGVDGESLLLDFVDATTATSTPSPVAAATARREAPTATRGSEGSDTAAAGARELRVAKARAAARRAEAGETAAPAKIHAEVVQPAAASAAARRPAPPVAEARSVPAVERRSVIERPVVILDPGHGGKDPGARAWTGEVEKDIVLDLAERVARRLRSRGDVEVVMTRSGDEYVELADRRAASARWGADVFVSIHANASHNVAARGIETYYHSRNAGDRGMRRLVRAENGGRSAKSGPSVSSGSRAGVSKASLSPSSAPLLDRRPESIRLARAVQGELVRQLGMRYEAVRDLGAKEGPFFVIGENAAPSVLVEAAFLTHREEGLRMRSEVYREQIADGVARGIVLFLEQQRRTGTL